MGLFHPDSTMQYIIICLTKTMVLLFINHSRTDYYISFKADIEFQLHVSITNLNISGISNISKLNLKAPATFPGF